MFCLNLCDFIQVKQSALPVPNLYITLLKEENIFQALFSVMYRHMYLHVLVVPLTFDNLLHYILYVLISFSKNGCSFINDDLSFLLF